MSETQDQLASESPILAYYKTRNQRLELNRLAAALEIEESKLKYQIVKEQKTLDVPTGYVLDIYSKDVPFVEDWPLFSAWVRENDALDCLQKRVTDSAIKARLEDLGTIPGVKLVPKTTLTVEYNG